MKIDLNGVINSASHAVSNVGTTVVQTVQNGIGVSEISPQDILKAAIAMPGVRINREEYLKKEFANRCSTEVMKSVLRESPASAGIPLKTIEEVADSAISFETRKTTLVSTAAGLPGGFAILASVSADLAQYYGNMLRVMQKLAYLYGFQDFALNQDEISDETMNQLLVMLAVMIGVKGANETITKFSFALSNKVARSLASKPLTKGAIYPVVKKAANAIGVKMTKDIFSKSVSKTVPVAGAVMSGGITYITFKPGALRLKRAFITMTKEGKL